jgi:hypothetical protein
MTRRLLAGLAFAALLALTGCRGENPEVAVQRYQYLVDLCNEIRSIDHDLTTVRDPAERTLLDCARRVRVWLYNDRWAAFGRPEFETAGLPSRVGSAMPTRCGGLS